MNNDETLKILQKKYESLKYFKVNGSMLTLEYNGYFKIPFKIIVNILLFKIKRYVYR